MHHVRIHLLPRFVCLVVVLMTTAPAHAQRHRHFLMDEQGQVQVRQPEQFPPARMTTRSAPPTVARPLADLEPRDLSLDDTLRIGLQNTNVVRILSGVGAASTGVTIYSPAISNTQIDRARATFDPRFTARNNFLRSENPAAVPLDPFRSRILGRRSDDYDFSMDLNQRLLSGADVGLHVGTNLNRLQPDGISFNALNPQSTSVTELSLTQPLLQGYGANANRVPIVLAFIDTERSYFRLKDALQNMVLGIIQGYWDLVQARLEVWVIEQQIRQASFVNELNEAALEIGRADAGELAQSRATLANFRANLVTANANVLNRAASLRGVLGLPPDSDYLIVPTTPPFSQPLEFDWPALLDLAETHRPDVIEFKLILEADQQRLVQAHNLAQPQLDAVASYRWNGLEGVMPIGDRLSANPNDHTGWLLGVTFSVPLTLRADRANLRQSELLLAQDRANLEQVLLETTHRLAFALRNIEQLSQQRVAFQQARDAAKQNLDLQFQEYQAGRTNFVEVLLAINTWASSVTSESQAVTQFNTALATLELETGTILETHGIRTVEERYGSVGPLGRWGPDHPYPSALPPSENVDRYPVGTRPSEESFDLTSPVASPASVERLPDITSETTE